jgi:aromatic ring hydroxylase
LIQKYYRGADVNAEEKMQIYKIAADIAVSAFGSRHELYERYYAGDPLFLRVETQYRNYDKAECLMLVEKMYKDLNVNLSKTLV